MTASVPIPSRPWTVWAQIATLLGVFGLLYAPVFAYLIRTWRGRDDYSHGFLVLPIALYLAWSKREQLKRLPIDPSFLLGVPLILVAGLMLILGRFGGAVVLQDFSLPVIIVGFVLTFLGRAHLKTLAPPIAYLLFMLPILGEESGAVHWPFQLLAANIGVGLLQSLGVAAFRESQYIHLPRITLEVAEACSGLRYLLSVVAIGIPLAHLTQRTWPRRVALVLSAVVIAVLANGLRVSLIGMWAYYGGEVVHGPFHVFQGLFVAWIGFLALFLGAWLLHKSPVTFAKQMQRAR